MILLIDNYDSFTYNLYQYAGLFCRDIKVFRNDKITIDTSCRMKPDRIILSPGPGSPNEAGICVEVIKKLYTKIPILGICLGHQCIAKAFGGAVSYAKELFHGRQSPVVHDGTGVFAGLASPVMAARYHSLAVVREGLPDCLRVTAETPDGEIMAMEHRQYPVFGVQFHPESVYTRHGKGMIKNFIIGGVR